MNCKVFDSNGSLISCIDCRGMIWAEARQKLFETMEARKTYILYLSEDFVVERFPYNVALNGAGDCMLIVTTRNNLRFLTDGNFTNQNALSYRSPVLPLARGYRIKLFGGDTVNFINDNSHFTGLLEPVVIGCKLVYGSFDHVNLKQPKAFSLVDIDDPSCDLLARIGTINSYATQSGGVYHHHDDVYVVNTDFKLQEPEKICIKFARSYMRIMPRIKKLVPSLR